MHVCMYVGCAYKHNDTPYGMVFLLDADHVEMIENSIVIGPFPNMHVVQVFCICVPRETAPLNLR